MRFRVLQSFIFHMLIVWSFSLTSAIKILFDGLCWIIWRITGATKWWSASSPENSHVISWSELNNERKINLRMQFIGLFFLILTGILNKLSPNGSKSKKTHNRLWKYQRVLWNANSAIWSLLLFIFLFLTTSGAIHVKYSLHSNPLWNVSWKLNCSIRLNSESLMWTGAVKDTRMFSGLMFLWTKFCEWM